MISYSINIWRWRKYFKLRAKLPSSRSMSSVPLLVSTIIPQQFHSNVPTLPTSGSRTGSAYGRRTHQIFHADAAALPKLRSADETRAKSNAVRRVARPVPAKADIDGGHGISAECQKQTSHHNLISLKRIGADGVLRSFGFPQRRAPADDIGAFLRHHQYAGVD